MQKFHFNRNEYFDTTITCEQHGVSTVRAWRCQGEEYIPGCRACEKAAREAARAEEDREVRQLIRRESERRRKDCNIPHLFTQASFNNFAAITRKQMSVLAKVRTYAEQFDDVQRRGANLLLSGPVGTGKTHLLCAVAHHLLEGEHSVRYVTAFGLVASFKEIWNGTNALPEAKLYAQYARVELLIIDDIGATFGTQAEKTILAEVIARRYDKGLPTAIATNLNRAALTEALGDRAVDRLSKVGSTILVLEWPSYRQRPVPAREERSAPVQ